MQSKSQSIIETITQTFIGLATSILIQILLYPAMGIPVTLSQNVIITIVFFVVSVLRGYLVRRFFTKKSEKQKLVKFNTEVNNEVFCSLEQYKKIIAASENISKRNNR